MTVSDPLGQLLNSVSADPDVVAAAKQLALETVAHARFLLANGGPDVRAKIIATLLPTAVQSMKQKKEDGDQVAMRAEFELMLEEMRDG